MRCGARRSVERRRAGFTLIELLVVIAVVALLIALSVPAMGKARRCVKRVREMAAAQQLVVAVTAYANDHKTAILPGFPPKESVSGAAGVHDEQGRVLPADTAQRYPWRLAPYLDFNFRGLYDDWKFVQEIRDNESAYTALGVDYAYVISLFPSLGMNVAFVGGSEKFGAWDGAFTRKFGTVYSGTLDTVRRPSEVIAFASAKCEQQPLLPQIGRPEGFFRVEPPYFGAAQGRRWAPAYDPDAPYPGLNSGFVSLRHEGRAVTVMLDGHSSLLGWDELGDMRRWADVATNPTWTVGSR